jgi:hypothetical protein
VKSDPGTSRAPGAAFIFVFPPIGSFAGPLYFAGHAEKGYMIIIILAIDQYHSPVLQMSLALTK